jgi:alpha-ketoglutarate-dependent taurine dioxygenase
MSTQSVFVYRHIVVRPLAPALGAEVVGIDLGSPLSEQTRAEVMHAWQHHLVLVFPNQPISDEQQISFSREFADLEVYPLSDNRDVGHPEIFRVSNCDLNGTLLPANDPESLWNNLTEYWHTDSSYRAVPAKGAVLHGIEVPQRGADTTFVNLTAAFEALPALRRSELEGYDATHDWEFGYSYASHLMKAMDGKEVAAVPPVRHPLVRTDQTTGRKSLYISPGYICGISGMGDDSAQSLIKELCDWATRPEFVFKHHWQNHDVLMWDNRTTMHARDAFDFGEHRRIMHRTTLVGDAAVV